MTSPPRSDPPPYNERLPGVYGEFGSGNNLRAFYLQTAISPRHLDKISLVKDVPGSAKWRVRDLFQREVDDKRVTDSLLPYLESRDKIKFFNPLTLTILPINEQDGRVLSQMPKLFKKTEARQGRNWTVIERDGLFRLRWVTEEPEYGELDWHSDRCQIVAIDGQHRLSALKRMQSRWLQVERLRSGDLDQQLGGAPPDARRSFLRWRIPVVVVSFRAEEGRTEPPSVLEVVRSIFVYINTEAREVGEARKVLLNDESVNCIAAQELLEAAHRNDLRPRAKRRNESVPLLFFDWRGQEEGGKPVPMPSAVKAVGELRDWFKYYILGEDFGDRQEAALGVTPGDRLKRAFLEQRLTYVRSRSVRKRVSDHLLPAVSFVLENFVPYQRYIAGLRELEAKYESGNDLQYHAFDRLRFDISHEPGVNKIHVDEVEEYLLVEIERLRAACLVPERPIDEDIGMRGIMESFGWLARKFDHPEWIEYADWFSRSLNLIYEDGWFEVDPGGSARKHLRHIVVDHNDTVVNYRLEHASKALGAYVSLLVGARSRPLDHWGVDWSLIENRLLSRLQSTVASGYRKEVRPGLWERFPNGGKELNEAVRKEAERRARKQIRGLEGALRSVAISAESE